VSLFQIRTLSLLACTALVPCPARADEPVALPDASAIQVSGSASVLSQYRFRGISRSDGQPAVQADITLDHAGGLYGGVMLASEQPGEAVDFGHGEIDLYAGYQHDLGTSGTTLDLGVRGYLYPDRTHADLVELSAALDHQIGPVDLRAGLAYAPSQPSLGRTSASGNARDNVYAHVQARADVPGTPLHLHAHLGHTAGGLDFPRAYFDYRVGLGASRKAFGVDLSLVGTNLSHDATAPDPLAAWRAVRSAAVVSLSYQF